jgi:hypothetical protein
MTKPRPHPWDHMTTVGRDAAWHVRFAFPVRLVRPFAGCHFASSETAISSQMNVTNSAIASTNTCSSRSLILRGIGRLRSLGRGDVTASGRFSIHALRDFTSTKYRLPYRFAISLPANTFCLIDHGEIQ